MTSANGGWWSSGVRNSMESPGGVPKSFTLGEANRTLPLVRRVVADIVDSYAQLQVRVQDYNRRLAERGEEPETEAVRREMQRDADRIDAFIGELHGLGCQFKGFEEGLVDFRGSYRGRPILLCWKLGEERIAWWHELEAGYAGRQPITEAMEVELEGEA